MFSDLHLESNACFVLAEPCEMQRDLWKGFDQISPWKCQTGFLWHFHFYFCRWTHKSCFPRRCSSKCFFVQQETSCLKKVLLLDPSPLQLLLILHQQRVWLVAFVSGGTGTSATILGSNTPSPHPMTPQPHPASHRITQFTTSRHSCRFCLESRWRLIHPLTPPQPHLVHHQKNAQ